jgi:hypothetical protein
MFPPCRTTKTSPIAELVAGEPDVTEQRMFGGLAFLVGGNMSVAASGQGGLMVRIEPGGLRTKRQLAPWVTRGVAYARSLPAKL